LYFVIFFSYFDKVLKNLKKEEMKKNFKYQENLKENERLKVLYQRKRKNNKGLFRQD